MEKAKIYGVVDYLKNNKEEQFCELIGEVETFALCALDLDNIKKIVLDMFHKKNGKYCFIINLKIKVYVGGISIKEYDL